MFLGPKIHHSIILGRFFAVFETRESLPLMPPCCLILVPAAVSKWVSFRITTLYENNAFWKPLGGREQCTGHGGGWILGPPNYKFSKKTSHQSPQTKEHLVTPCAQARWWIHYITHSKRHRKTLKKHGKLFETILVGF